MNNFWLLIITRAVIFSLIFLSITVITGMAGQISLCQASFAAVGSFGTAQLAQRFDLPVLLTMVIGAAMAAMVGALLAIPALRLGGIFLALATLAFAFMFDSIFVPLDWVSGGRAAARRFPAHDVRRGDRRRVFLLCGLVARRLGYVVILVRQGDDGEIPRRGAGQRDGRALDRHQSRPGQRVVAFALSAGIAGLGGGLLAMLRRTRRTTPRTTACSSGSSGW